MTAEQDEARNRRQQCAERATMAKASIIRFQYKDKQYIVSGVEHPHGFIDLATVAGSSQWIRYAALLRLSGGKLVLWDVHGSRETGESEDLRSLNQAIAYTGAVILGKGNLWPFHLRGYMTSYTPVIAYASVVELRFTNGELSGERDLSEAARAMREAQSEVAYEGLRGDFPGWVNALPFGSVQEAAAKRAAREKRSKRKKKGEGAQ